MQKEAVPRLKVVFASVSKEPNAGTAFSMREKMELLEMEDGRVMLS